MTYNQFSLKLKSFRMITPSVRHMEFVRENGAKLTYTPGQFITIHFEMNGTQYNRSYSIASIPSHTDSIEVAVSPFPGGPGTEFLFSMKPGESVQTTGPFGRLILREEKIKRLILVATGTGITPYRAMLPELHRRIEAENIVVEILLGVQSPVDLLYGEDFIHFAAKHPNLHFHVFYSRQMPKVSKVFEHQGYVQSYFDQLNLDPQRDIVYLCGNPHMIDDAFKMLIDKGFPIPQIRREKYISPKR